MDRETAQQLIKETTENYNTISEHFSKTRKAQWYSVSALIEQYISPGQTVLDLGCGNGRIADLTSEIKARYTGMDVAPQMIEIAKQLHPDLPFAVGSIVETGFADASFDHVLMIASFHHVPSHEMRVEALQEVYRILKPGGIVIMSNWNLHQWIFLRQRLRTNIQKLFGHHHRDYNDLLIPWKSSLGEQKADRYYHSFTKKEMEGLVGATNFRILDHFYDSNGMRVPRRKAHNLMTVLQK
jgi:ubiquinone/menaquinone biosynthesis C-methylase UbiE